MLLLGEQDFAASNHDSFDANSLVMVTLRQATSSRGLVIRITGGYTRFERTFELVETYFESYGDSFGHNSSCRSTAPRRDPASDALRPATGRDPDSRNGSLLSKGI